MQRRGFLTGLGCSLAASPLVTPVALAEGPWDNRLIVIVLRGAMDGLDAIRPVGDPAYAGLRPTLAGNGLPLTDFWALHPSLAPLMPLWRAGEFGAAHATSTPYRDRRSHFDGQDILEAGTVGLDGARDGWLNRLLTEVPGARAGTAYAVGRDAMPVLAGDAPVSRWSPDARLAISPQAERLLGLVYEDDPLFHVASADALRIAAEVDGAQSGGAEMMRVADFAAARLVEEARIASFSIGGWDTHGRQEVHLARALEGLAEVVLRLRDGLGPVWARTGVLCLTEFGRTARENGSGGTDHGTGGAMLYFGGGLRGGRVLGDWPGLGDLYADRDLMPVRDVRAYAGWAMRGLFGVDAGVVERVVFPGLELGESPRIV